MILISTESYFNTVYNETLRKISRYVISKCGSIQDADDIIQNVYSRFYQRIEQKGFEDIDSPEAFLVNIAKFECKTYFSNARKSRDRYSTMSEYAEEEMTSLEAEMSQHQKGLEDVLCNEVLAKQIFEDIAKSDPDVGKIFYLHFACDMKLEDVANTLGIKLSTVKTKLYRTIEKQKKKFDI